jgi:hypothetical protein
MARSPDCCEGTLVGKMSHALIYGVNTCPIIKILVVCSRLIANRLALGRSRIEGEYDYNFIRNTEHEPKTQPYHHLSLTELATHLDSSNLSKYRRLAMTIS